VLNQEKSEKAHDNLRLINKLNKTLF